MSENTQEIPQLRSTASKAPKQESQAINIDTTNAAYETTDAQTKQNNAIEESPWNCQKKNY